uniref:Baseplate protein n=1 Tax=Siphoviridae sp. ctpbb7 TaxID=2826465 RepID=A0A8S5N1E4_9CAUD|nr:MAG TPA: baseplate protein [Siphoviridae sp. ctpbb7]
MIRLITGYAGVGHVTSADAGRFNAGICGNDAYIMQTGEQMAYTLNSNNEITIGSGDLVNQGRHFSIPQNSSETLQIENGSQGKTRYDAVVVRYSKDTGTGVESASMYVARGEEVSSTQNPPKPEVNRGNIFNGEITDDVILYYIKIVELNVDSVTLAVPILHSLTTIADVIYPVGSIYMSMADTDPSKLFGGTWSRIKDYFLLASETAGTTGGDRFIQIQPKNLPPHTHTIPSHQHIIPPHTHTVAISNGGAHTHAFSLIKTVAAGTASYRAASYGAAGAATAKTSAADAHTHKATASKVELTTEASGEGVTGKTGVGQELDIMPPYLTVNMWQRIG